MKEATNSLTSNQIPKLARMSDKNCSLPDIVPDCSRTEAIVLTEFSGSNRPVTAKLDRAGHPPFSMSSEDEWNICAPQPGNTW
jgi:hypothetical protein